MPRGHRVAFLCHQIISQGPAQPRDPSRTLVNPGPDFARIRHLALKIEPHVVGELLVLDAEHDLEVEEQTAHSDGIVLSEGGLRVREAANRRAR